MASRREDKLLGEVLLQRLREAGFGVDFSDKGGTVFDGPGVRLHLLSTGGVYVRVKDVVGDRPAVDFADWRTPDGSTNDCDDDWFLSDLYADGERTAPTSSVDEVSDGDDVAEVEPVRVEIPVQTSEQGSVDVELDEALDALDAFLPSWDENGDSVCDAEPVEVRLSHTDYWDEWVSRWQSPLMCGVPGSGLYAGSSGVTATKAGAAGERALADTFDWWRDGEVLAAVPSYWSMALPDDGSGWSWSGDVDCVLDLGRTLVLIDAKNYGYRGSQYTATPDGASLYALGADGGVAEAHRMSCNMSEAMDRYARSFPDKTVVGVVVLMDMGRTDEHPAEGLVEPGLRWAGDARLSVLDEAGLLQYLATRLPVQVGVQLDARLVDLVQVPEGYAPTRSDELHSEDVPDDPADSSSISS